MGGKPSRAEAAAAAVAGVPSFRPAVLYERRRFCAGFDPAANRGTNEPAPARPSARPRAEQGLDEYAPTSREREEGARGARLERPGLARRREAAARGEGQRLLVTAPDRVARGVGHHPFLVLVQDRFWGNVVSYFACDIPQSLSGS